MTGILLAAGIGSRLRPLTESRPKCLLEVGGVTLLERTLRAFVEAGVDECLLVTGYLQGMVEGAVRGFGLPLKVRFVHNERFGATNNNYSLWLAGLQAEGEDIILLDGDILFETGILRSLIGAAEPDALVVRAGGPLGAEEIKVELDGAGAVRRIGKEVDPGCADGESIGIEKFSAPAARELFRILGRRRERYEFYEASFQELIDGGVRLAAVSAGGMACMEIDTPQDLEAAGILASTRGL